MLRNKLQNLDYNWITKLSFNEILELFKFTKSFPMVHLQIRKYCFIYKISKYPIKNGKYLKPRDGIYGFYKNKFLNSPKFHNTIEELKEILTHRNFLSNISYNDLIIIKKVIPQNINCV
jgi:hypothetical protein